MVHGILLFVGVVLATGVVISATAIWLMASALMRPPRMTDGKALYLLRRLSPADLAMPFEQMDFSVRDEHEKPLKIAGWWIPNTNANGRCAVLIHGYADAKVGALAWAPVWHSLGFNLYLPDLRAHGESGGTACTGGYYERDDISQAIDQLRVGRPKDARQIILFGASLGAAVALAVATERTDISGVVMDSPFADFASASAAHMGRLGLPGKVFQKPAIDLARRLSNAEYAAVSPLRLLMKKEFPTLLILPEADPFLTSADRERMRTLVDAEFIWNVPNVAHLMALAANPTEYARRLYEFTETATRAPLRRSGKEEP